MNNISLLRRIFSALRKQIFLIVLFVVVTIVIWGRFFAAIGVNTFQVQRGTVVHDAFGRGTVESQREATLGFDMVGRLSDVFVDEGVQVILGQELARLEINQAQADFNTAESGVAAARASLRRIAADEARARAMLTAAERERTRIRSLIESGALPQAQQDEAIDRVRLARAELDRVLAQRAEATRGIETATGGVEQRRVAMVRATLLAPFDGLVTRRLREPGDTVVTGSTVLRLADTNQVYISAAIDETVLPLLATEQRASVLFPGTSSVFRGRVSRISWEADRQTHEVVVEVTPEALDRRVALGQRADIRIELARRENALWIPLRLVHRDDSGPYVYVNRAGRIALIRPNFGLTGIDRVEIHSGLVVGDTVLDSPKVGSALPLGRRWVAL